MATYTAQAIPKTGLCPPTFNAAAATDRVPPDSVLFVKNGNAASLTVTLISVDNADGDLTVSDRAQTAIATTTQGIIYVPNRWPYVDPADGLVGVQFSVQSSVTYAVVSTP